jgi:hypothetical protein
VTPDAKNRLAYAALSILNMALGVLAIQLGADKVPIPDAWQWTVPILMAVITGATMYLPRDGSAYIATQVNSLKAQGIHRADMVVLPKSKAVTAVTADPVQVAADNVMALDAKQRVRLEEEVERRHADMVAEQRPPTTAEVADQVAGIIDRSEREGGKG